jgi:hypothetical protein
MTFRNGPEAGTTTTGEEPHHQRRVAEPPSRTLLNTRPMDGFARRPFPRVPPDSRKPGTGGTRLFLTGGASS